MPSFVEDLIDFLTNGLISMNSIEEHMSQYRDTSQPDLKYTAGPLQDYIMAKNIEEYGHSIGFLPKSDTARRQRLG